MTITKSNTLRAGLPPLPHFMRSLEIDRRGYPIPWFVKWIDGAPDFRVLDEAKLKRALLESRCQICGALLGKFKCFVGGPLMIMQRISLEPPMHRECAQFAVQACPYMLHAAAKKRIAGMPAELLEQINEQSANGIELIEGNPGIFGIHVCTSYSVDTRSGVLRMGRPTQPIMYYIGGNLVTDESAISAAIERAVENAREQRARGPS